MLYPPYKNICMVSHRIPGSSQGPGARAEQDKHVLKLAPNPFIFHAVSTQRLAETEVVLSCLVISCGLSSFGFSGNFIITSLAESGKVIISFGKRCFFLLLLSPAPTSFIWWNLLLEDRGNKPKSGGPAVSPETLGNIVTWFPDLQSSFWDTWLRWGWSYLQESKVKSGRPTLRMRSLPAGLGSGKKETSSLTVFCVRVTGGKKKYHLRNRPCREVRRRLSREQLAIKCCH